MIITINFRSSNTNYFIYTLQNSLLAKIFIEPIIIFRKGPGAKLWSLFWMWDYQLYHGGPGTWQENMQNKRSKQDIISINVLVIVTLILKVVSNLFQTFHLQQMVEHDSNIE